VNIQATLAQCREAVAVKRKQFDATTCPIHRKRLAKRYYGVMDTLDMAEEYAVAGDKDETEGWLEHACRLLGVKVVP
jgi:hypothetical protein